MASLDSQGEDDCEIFLLEVPKPEGRIGCYGNGLTDAKEKPKI